MMKKRVGETVSRNADRWLDEQHVLEEVTRMCQQRCCNLARWRKEIVFEQIEDPCAKLERFYKTLEARRINCPNVEILNA